MPVTPLREMRLGLPPSSISILLRFRAAGGEDGGCGAHVNAVAGIEAISID